MKDMVQVFGGLALSFVLAAGAGAQQISPSGQAVPPGTQNRPGSTANCSGVDGNGMPLSPNDTSCGAFAPGFATPSTNAVQPDESVLAVVRVETIVEKPAKLPLPMDFTQVGTATMVKAKMPRLRACYMAGQILSNRSGAATSTTCMDRKGEVIAYQECKPKTDSGPMSCSTVTPDGQSQSTVARK